VVYQYLGCGDLKKGFARIKCQGEMRIISFSAAASKKQIPAVTHYHFI